MTNKYLEKIAKSHLQTGTLSPAWQEHAIAKEYDKKGPQGFKENLKAHLTGYARMTGRGTLEAIGGFALGKTLSPMLSRKLKYPYGMYSRFLAPIAGAAIGSHHGIYASLKNQANEHHEKYSK